MTERPILFQGAMVRAILSGTKIQTRRALAHQPPANTVAVGQWHAPPGIDTAWWAWTRDGPPDPESFTAGAIIAGIRDGSPLACPYGKPGDRLWGRENGWERPVRTPAMMRDGADTWAPYYYDADGISDTEAADLKAWGFKRRPSIHMPRMACRIHLEVTDIRVERLHAISEDDCIAEGAPGGHGAIAGYAYNATPREHYQHIWESLGGPGSWQANPWVWVVELRRLRP